MVGGLDEKEFTVGVPNPDRDGGDLTSDRKEKEDGKPLVLEIVTIPELAVEVRKIAGATDGAGNGGNGDKEGIMVPKVVMEVRCENAEDVELKRRKGSRRGFIGEDGEEEGIVGGAMRVERKRRRR